jgi:hypothetical protein
VGAGTAAPGPAVAVYDVVAGTMPGPASFQALVDNVQAGMDAGAFAPGIPVLVAMMDVPARGPAPGR